VMLLTAFLAIILMRVIRNDFTRYMRSDDDEELGEEETVRRYYRCFSVLSEVSSSLCHSTGLEAHPWRCFPLPYGG
jgi:hypothetical protein